MSQQLNIFGAIERDSASIAPDAIETKRLKQEAIQRYLDSGQKENIPHVNIYQVRRTKNHYFRLSYRQRGKMKHLHIPGGNTRAELALYRAKKIQELIDRGADLEEVIAAVKTYRSGAGK